MLSVAQAQAQLLAGIEPLTSETIDLTTACSRYLADDITARMTQPPFAASAMDGYAIGWADRAGPWTVIGEAVAGRGFTEPVATGQAVRIFTGAPLPDRTDTVAVQEDVVRDGDNIVLAGEGPPRRGANTRAQGHDFAAGDRLAGRGDRLTPARLGLLAAAGCGAVVVHRRPRVVLLATGDELVPPGTLPGPDQIVSSNGVMLAALFAAAGAEVIDRGIIADRSDALAAAIDAAADADLLITIGGASVGDHDLVQPVLRAMGAQIDFWKVAVKPGKPMLAGRRGTQRIIGLPGNPVSAYVTALLFAVPVARALAGATQLFPVVRHGRTTAPLAANAARQDYLRARAVATPAGWALTPFAAQDSAMLQVLADADALIVRAPGAVAVAAGAAVEFVALDTFRDVA